MYHLLLLSGIIILACVVANQFSDKLGLPALLLFMGLGMFFGSDGVVKIPFSDYEAANNLCTVGLILIMFYGGFCTNWKAAKPIAPRAILLSTVGVAVTALITALFCCTVLHFPWVEGLLVGAVLSSTDAASVFSILRSRRLNLREGTASLLEMESGSNDPMAYLMTLTGLLILQGTSTAEIPMIFVKQMLFGGAVGSLIALGGHWVYRNLRIIPEGMGSIYLMALMLLSYAGAETLGGNGFLSTYLFGILMGNLSIPNKKELISFFDGLSTLAQIVIFFLLGLLAFPHRLPQIVGTAAAVAVFLLLVARPVAVFGLLKPFRCSNRQCLLVAWAGLRGASSIVFAVMVLSQGAEMENDLFHIVFLVSLLSVALQGSLLPWVAQKLDMIDGTEDVRKTFNDYREESSLQLVELRMEPDSSWVGKRLRELSLPKGMLALQIQRGKETFVPNGETALCGGDIVTMGMSVYHGENHLRLEEVSIGVHHRWRDHTVRELLLGKNQLIVLIKRGMDYQIPNGQTKIKVGDVVILSHSDSER
jgi:cell volume regulation protein A